MQGHNSKIILIILNFDISDEEYRNLVDPLAKFTKINKDTETYIKDLVEKKPMKIPTKNILIYI